MTQTARHPSLGPDHLRRLAVVYVRQQFPERMRRFDFGAVSENVNDLLHDNWENRKSEWHYSVSRSEVR